ncbi:hypothetical protein G3N95_12090 [Paraburkholderia sp. Tr-20389]|uniref:hypothetical protein n=1 Tax=Paraburkholderia sp. Tr-20389 TaxID=2703903 RepID=UPI00197EA647|nr:hypothetical protein [Paraburkholderia sp. Tr-20389]MBN3753682.1 hypothetical protein [Paraburkholderia sp. Tr-20389]
MNALQDILHERTDEDVLAIVGPSGSPDDGFAISVPVVSPAPPASPVSPASPALPASPPLPVSPASPPSGGTRLTQAWDFAVAAGTMYVGGQRVTWPPTAPDASAPWSYFTQPDWLAPDDPLPVLTSPARVVAEPSARHGGIEAIWLDVFDQEVSATEDPDLKEVALGGPDTTGRVRTARRVRRTPVSHADCTRAWLDATASWSSQGLMFDPDTMRLEPAVRLQVSFEQDPAPPNPCDPIVKGGYLYADNQLIRIKIVPSETSASPDTFVWGYDNASFLYRVSDISGEGTQLQLADTPPDAYHRPQSGQAIEVLRTAHFLNDAAPSADGGDATVRCVAEATGVVRSLSAAYGAIVQGGPANYLSLSEALPADYLDDPNPLFVRIWQARQTLPADGGSSALQDATNGSANGVVLTFSGMAGGAPAAGAYWMIALRPATPQTVYPARFVDSPQPPDGPHRWACPLAVIDWTDAGSPSVTGCRSTFQNLVELSRRKAGCCTLSVSPPDLDATTLQTLIDTAAHTASHIRVCFEPGTFALRDALRLTPLHAGIVLEACNGGALLTPAPGADASFFADGLIVIEGATNVTLRGLAFASVAHPPSADVRSGMTWLTQALSVEIMALTRNGVVTSNPLWESPVETLTSQIARLALHVCVRAVSASNLTIDACNFVGATPASPGQLSNALSIGVLAQGDCTGFSIDDCTFEGTTPTLTPGPTLAGSLDVSKTLQTAVEEAARGASKTTRRLTPKPAVLDEAAKEPAKEPINEADGAQKPNADVKEPLAGAAGVATVRALQLVPDQNELIRNLPSLADFVRRPTMADAPPLVINAGILITPYITAGAKAMDPAVVQPKADVPENLLRLQFGLQGIVDGVQIRGNRFEGLTCAALSIASTGVVRIENNQVTNCAAGFWIYAQSSNYLQLDLRSPDPHTRGAEQMLLYALMFEETLLALFAPMLLKPPVRVRPATGAFTASAVHVSGNDIDCTLRHGSPLPQCSAALAVFADPSAQSGPSESTLSITDNRLNTNPVDWLPAVSALYTGSCTFTANHIANGNNDGGYSLRLQPTYASVAQVAGKGTAGNSGDATAITGNVIQRATNLASLTRSNQTAPLNTWMPFNAMRN